MFVYLVHHAEAVGPAVDPQRPLSERGAAHAAALAVYARARRVKPALIWHSGKLRSRQTAEAFLRACNPSAPFRAVRGLLPDDPIVWMENALALEDQNVLIVGHIPHLPALAEALGAGDPLPLHGMLTLERTGPLSYTQRWVAFGPASPGRTTER